MKSFKQFMEGTAPSADYKLDKLGRKIPARRIKIGDTEKEIQESTSQGNYVALDAPDLDHVWGTPYTQYAFFLHSLFHQYILPAA